MLNKLVSIIKQVIGYVLYLFIDNQKIYISKGAANNIVFKIYLKSVFVFHPY